MGYVWQLLFLFRIGIGQTGRGSASAVYVLWKTGKCLTHIFFFLERVVKTGRASAWPIFVNKRLEKTGIDRIFKCSFHPTNLQKNTSRTLGSAVDTLQRLAKTGNVQHILFSFSRCSQRLAEVQYM